MKISIQSPRWCWWLPFPISKFKFHQSFFSIENELIPAFILCESKNEKEKQKFKKKNCFTWLVKRKASPSFIVTDYNFFHVYSLPQFYVLNFVYIGNFFLCFPTNTRRRMRIFFQMFNKLTFSAMWKWKIFNSSRRWRKEFVLLLDGWVFLCVLRSRFEHFHLVDASTSTVASNW